MDKQELLEGLKSYRDRLSGEVVDAYRSRGSSFGDERFAVWRKKFRVFLDTHFPGESVELDGKLRHIAFVMQRGESDLERFWREDGETVVSFIDSLVIDVQNNEYERKETPSMQQGPAAGVNGPSNKVFIVHGHDDLVKTQTARFIEKLGYEAVILHEQASSGRTIIEKIEACTDVGFAIVLYTPDDKGSTKGEAESGNLNDRARQNVVFEHGYLIAKLGRNRVVPLIKGNVELPNDISGIVYISDKDWQVDIAKEMKAAGYEIDLNKVL